MLGVRSLVTGKGLVPFAVIGDTGQHSQGMTVSQHFLMLEVHYQLGQPADHSKITTTTLGNYYSQRKEKW